MKLISQIFCASQNCNNYCQEVSTYQYQPYPMPVFDEISFHHAGDMMQDNRSCTEIFSFLHKCLRKQYRHCRSFPFFIRRMAAADSLDLPTLRKKTFRACRPGICAMYHMLVRLALPPALPLCSAHEYSALRELSCPGAARCGKRCALPLAAARRFAAAKPGRGLRP